MIFKKYPSLLAMNLVITQQIYHWLDFEWKAKLTEDYEVIADQSEDKRWIYSQKN